MLHEHHSMTYIPQGLLAMSSVQELNLHVINCMCLLAVLVLMWYTQVTAQRGPSSDVQITYEDQQEVVVILLA